MIFYESPHRLIKTLEQFAAHFGEERQASVSRELSKLFEETINGSLKEIINYFAEKIIKVKSLSWSKVRNSRYYFVWLSF
jgi:16S rRNA (cytidine1402-2'-O)-methyltransferase